MSTSEPLEREFPEGHELVAYLDGELPPDASRQIEARLANDADYRDQLRYLDQAWEALDALPRTVADDDFARTTIEMVAQKAQIDLSERVAEVAQVERRNHLRWVAAAVLLAAASFTITSMALPNRDQMLLEHLPVIRQSHLLSEITDIDFLEALANEVSLDHLVRYPDAFDREMKAIESASAPMEARKEWVQKLSAEQQQSLDAQQTRYFDEFNDEKRERLNNLYAAILKHREHEKLQKVLVAYGQWLSTPGRGENLKAELRDPNLEPNERVGLINYVVLQETAERGRALSEEERSRLREEIHKIAEENKEAALEFARNVPPRDNEDPRVWNEHKAKVVKALEEDDVPAELVSAYWALLNPGTADETRARLVKQLDQPTLQFLESRDALRREGDRRPSLLFRWILETMSLARGVVRTEELMKFFKDQKLDEKQRLLGYSSAEFEQEVRNVMVEQENGIRELGQLMGVDLGRGGQRGQRGGLMPGGRGGRGGFDPNRRGGSGGFVPGGAPMPGPGPFAPPGPPSDGKRG
jgi:hypothetical protein